MGDSEATVAAAGTPRPKITRTQSWLNHVANDYVAQDTLKMVKFSFRGEIAKKKLEELDSLYSLFLVVREDLYQGDESKALSRIIYSLDLVGHRRYGKRSVRDLKEFEIEQPKAYDPSKDSKEVQLFQVLAEVASRLKPRHADRLREYYAEKLLDGINPEGPSTSSLLSLFARLVQEKRITGDDQKQFVRALSVVGADYCFIFLKEYRLRNGLLLLGYPELESVRSGTSSKTGSRSSSFWLNETEDPTYVQTEDPYEGAVGHDLGLALFGQDRHSALGSVLSDDMRATPKAEYIRRDTDAQGVITGHGQDGRPQGITVGSRRGSSEPPVVTVREGTEDDTETTPLVRPRPSTPIGWKKIICAAACVIICLIVAMVMMAVCGYTTYHAAYHQYRDESQLVYEESTIPLYRILPYYLTEIKLSEKLEHIENAHDIDFYLVDSDCRNVLTNENTTFEHSTLASSLPNFTGLYLMPNSKISYNICALTEADPRYGVRIEVFILDNLEDAHNFDPAHAPIYRNFRPCYKSDTKPCTCESITYQTTHPGYYSVQFYVTDDSHPMQYNYSTSVRKVTIASPPNDIVYQCSVSDEGEQCTLPINDTDAQYPHNMNKPQCIIADIAVNEPEESNYLHIMVDFTNKQGGLIASIFFLALSFGLFILLAVCVVTCHALFKYRRNHV